MHQIKDRNSKLFEVLRTETKKNHELTLEVKLLKRRLGEVVSDSDLGSESESD